MPEVLKETFGLRNAATDGAVGLRRDLKRGGKAGGGMVRERRELGVGVGIGVGGRQVCLFFGFFLGLRGGAGWGCGVEGWLEGGCLFLVIEWCSVGRTSGALCFVLKVWD